MAQGNLQDPSDPWVFNMEDEAEKEVLVMDRAFYQLLLVLKVKEEGSSQEVGGF